MTRLVLLAAVAENGVIGADGAMPWHYPADLQHFKETTTGHPVVMGRRTYESIADRIGGPLPERTTVLLSRSDPDVSPDVLVAESVEQALDAVEEATESVESDENVEEREHTAYVVGGATVYEQFLPLADAMILTEIHEAYEGDTHFPEWDDEEWTEVSRDERGEFAFVHYER
jgi:dihydrofolate reductase